MEHHIEKEELQALSFGKNMFSKGINSLEAEALYSVFILRGTILNRIYLNKLIKCT